MLNSLSLTLTLSRGELRDARKDVSKRDGEEVVLLRRPDGDANRLRRAEAVELGATITPSRCSRSKSARPPTDIDEEKVAE